MRQFQRLLVEALSERRTANEVLHELEAVKGYIKRILGEVRGKPILLLTQQEKKPRPNLLVASGFHGNEQAGPFGILHFLQNNVAKVNLSFLPLVNPTGFDQNKRDNHAGHNPNRGFDKNRPVSDEGNILLKHDVLLKSLARDGFMSLHEDMDKETFHIFVYEHADKPTAFAEQLRACGTKFERAASIGALDQEEEGGLHNQRVGDVVEETGMVFNDHDGSYEDYLSLSGVPFTACTETGGKIDFETRVRANAELIKAFAAHANTSAR